MLMVWLGSEAQIEMIFEREIILKDYNSLQRVFTGYLKAKWSDFD